MKTWTTKLFSLPHLSEAHNTSCEDFESTVVYFKILVSLCCWIMSRLCEWRSVCVILVRPRQNKAPAFPQPCWIGLFPTDVVYKLTFFSPSVFLGCSLFHTTHLSLFRLNTIFSPKQRSKQDISVSYFTMPISLIFSSLFLFSLSFYLNCYKI